MAIYFSIRVALQLGGFENSSFLIFKGGHSAFRVCRCLVLAFGFGPVGGFSPTVSMVINLFVLFTNVCSICNNNGATIVIGRMGINNNPIYLSRGVPLMFCSDSVDVMRIVTSNTRDGAKRLVVSNGFNAITYRHFSLFGKGDVVPVPRLRPKFCAVRLSVSGGIFTNSFFVR